MSPSFDLKIMISEKSRNGSALISGARLLKYVFLFRLFGANLFAYSLHVLVFLYQKGLLWGVWGRVFLTGGNNRNICANTIKETNKKFEILWFNAET